MTIKKLSVVWMSLVLILLLGACSDEEEKQVENTNPVLAVVNGIDIKQDFIDKTYDTWLFMKGAYEGNDEVDAKSDQKEKEELFHYGRRESAIIKTNLLQLKINGIVLENHYKSLNQAISDKELEEKYVQMMDIMKEKKPEVMDFYSEKKIDKDFIKEGIKTNYYITKFYEDFDEKYREEYKISEAEYKNSKLNVNLAVILVQDKETIDQVYQKIQDGAKFEDMVKEYSIDESSKARNGELGTLKIDEIPLEFSLAIANLKKDQISKPFKSLFGYNIVKLIDYRTVEDMLKDENLTEGEEASTKSYLYDCSLRTKLQEELDKLIEKAEVKIVKDFYKEDAEK